MPPLKHALVLASLENLALSVIRSLAGKGYCVTVAGAGPGRMLRLSRHCSEYVRVAVDGPELAAGGGGALESVERLARKTGAEIVVPVDVPGALLAARLRLLLTRGRFFPFAETETLRRLDNKWTFYGLLMEHGLPAPRTTLLENAAQVRDLPLPLVLKPLSEAGGKGVSVVHDVAARDARLGGRAAHLAFPTLAQEFIEGEDVSLSFLAERGRVIAWAVHMRLRDGSVEYIEDERVGEIGRRIAAATAYTGVANVDMRYEGFARSRVLVLECNPRFWGTFKYTQGLGIDYMGLGLELAAGGSPATIARSPVASCPGLFATVKRFLKGDLRTSAASSAYLCQKLGDPVPELYCGALRLFGVDGGGL